MHQKKGDAQISANLHPNIKKVHMYEEEASEHYTHNEVLAAPETVMYNRGALSSPYDTKQDSKVEDEE